MQTLPPPAPPPGRRPSPLPWVETVWTQVSLYKKLMMHLKEHCSYITLQASPTRGLMFCGTSAIDHLCVRVDLPPACFVEYQCEWPSADDAQDAGVDLNAYTLYSIMKKATAFRHERVRFRVAWHADGYYAVTVTFETVNKRERFHMRGGRAARSDVCVPPLPPRCDEVAARLGPLATVHTALLVDCFNRFDEESFRTVTLNVHAHDDGAHPHTVSVAPTRGPTLTLKGRTDTMRGRVYLPYRTTRKAPADAPSADHRFGHFLLASLRAVARFASLATTKCLSMQQVRLSANAAYAPPLCLTFDVVGPGTVTCYLPAVTVDGWSDAGGGSSSSEDEWPSFGRA